MTIMGAIFIIELIKYNQYTTIQVQTYCLLISIFVNIYTIFRINFFCLSQDEIFSKTNFINYNHYFPDMAHESLSTSQMVNAIVNYGCNYQSEVINISVTSQQIYNAFIGGLLIAIAASLYYIYFGRILGMSGILGSIMTQFTSTNFLNKLPIISGLILSSLVAKYMVRNGQTRFVPFDDKQIETSELTLIIAGLLVGIGTYLGSGCTSGHGLCGLPRFSVRSFVAVMCFLSMGILTATFNISKYIPATPEAFKILNNVENINQNSYYVLVVVLFMIGWIAFMKGHDHHRQRTTLQYTIYGTIQSIVLLLTGFIFGSGLLIGGMVQRQNLYNFLNLGGNWNFSLMIVLFTGVLVNLFLFNLSRLTFKGPLNGKSFSNPKGKPNLKLILGACLFGIGWGLGGLCPGPFILLITGDSIRIPLYWGISFVVGRKLTIMAEYLSEPGKNKID